MDQKLLLRLVKEHGTPLFIVDHKVLREDYATFRKHLPRVQVYSSRPTATRRSCRRSTTSAPASTWPASPSS